MLDERADPPATILVVDDNPATLYATRRVLSNAGFRVLEAKTGMECLTRATADAPDLVVLDVHLPDIDGIEVCRRLRAHPATSRTPVVHLSATFTHSDDRAHGLEAGADGYLTHPVEPPVLVATVRVFLRAREAEAQRAELLERERAARAEAERANRLKDEFLATLSHELRTPLNAILGWSQILLRAAPEDSDQRQGLVAIERNARAQTQLISDLLDVSRITSGQLRLDIRPLDLAAVIDAAVATAVPAAEVRRIQIHRAYDPMVGPVHGDASRLQQVVWNLIANAVKFTARGGNIRVTLAQREASVEVTVSDDGQGISAEFLPYVFERFRQADASSTRRHGGLGLGLAIVKSLTELHGGTVTARSEGAGRGASFTVTLPCGLSDGVVEATPSVAPDAPMPDAAADVADAVDLRGLRVLVVDDDSDARTLMARVLRDVGADVMTSEGVRDALVLVASFEPHVLVSDIGMPGEDGYDLIRQVRASGRSVHSLPAIALTAFARAEDRRRALRAGFQVHIAKPVEPAELEAAVESLAGRSSERGR